MTTRYAHPRSTRPLTLREPPVYLSRVPDAIMQPSDTGKFAGRLEGWLATNGIASRPTLAEVEAERARRGLRNLPVASATAPTRLVLSMLAPAVPELEAVRERGRLAVERIRARLDGASANDVYGSAVAFSREARQAQGRDATETHGLEAA